MFVSFNDHEGKKTSGLVFSHCQWEQLHSQVTQKQTEQEEKEKKKAILLKRKEMSAEMAKTWDNTYINIRKRRYEKRKERFKKEKELRDKLSKQLQEENEKAKNKIREQAKDVAFYNQDCTKTFHSAFRQSETQAERKAQLEFNEKLKKINEEIELKYAESIINDDKRFREEQEEEKRRKQEWKREMGIAAKKKHEEDERMRRDEIKERQKREKEDMEILKRQMEMVIENEKREIMHQKEMVRINLMENREMVEKSKRVSKLEEEEENKALEIISKGKMRIAQIRRVKEEEMLNAKRNRFQALSGNIEQEAKKKLEEEEEIYRRAVEEKEQRETAARNREKERLEMLRNERINEHLKHIKLEEEKLAREREQLKWEILRRFKREEINNQFTKKVKDEKVKKTMNTKYVLMNQVEEDIDRRVKEKELELEAARKTQERWEKSDMEFLEYAYNVREESAMKGRPLYPLDAAIYDFKKRNKLLKNERNFIYDAKINRPDGISEYTYEPGFTDKFKHLEKTECQCNPITDGTIEREDCGCAKKANGLPC